MKKSAIYKFVLLSMASICTLLVIIAYYSSGIIEFSSVANIAEERISVVALAVEKSKAEIANLSSQFRDDNISKAKSLSYMIANSKNDIFDNETIEEIRNALGLEEILLTDAEGIVITGTSAFLGHKFADNEIYSKFLPILTNRSRTITINIEADGKILQYAGVSRIDEKGIVLIKSSANFLAKAIKHSDISAIIAGYPILKRGCTAIIDKESWTFISHTDQKYHSQAVQIPISDFKKLGTDEMGSIKTVFGNRRSYIFYREYNENIIAVIIPTSEVFSRRNYIVTAITVTSFLMCLTAVLSMRTMLIKSEGQSRREQSKPN